MKFQTASAIFLSLASAVVGQYDTLIPGPVCARFKQFELTGIGEFVDTDGNGALSQGDLSISADGITGTTASGKYPNQQYFRNLNIDMNAVCVATTDIPSAPVCFYEAEFSFCRSYLIIRDDIRVERVAAGKTIQNFDELVMDFEKDKKPSGLRRTQDERVIGNKPGTGEFRPDDDSRMIEAVSVDQLYEGNEALFKAICPSLSCYIPYRFFCFDTQSGGFTAHGSGDQNIKITGGTGGFFGAFGQIKTPATGIAITPLLPSPDVSFAFDADIELCYYRTNTGFW